MLVLDVFDDRVPATPYQHGIFDPNRGSLPSLVIDLVTVAWCVDDVEPQTNSVLLDDCAVFSVKILLR